MTVILHAFPKWQFCESSILSALLQLFSHVYQNSTIRLNMLTGKAISRTLYLNLFLLLQLSHLPLPLQHLSLLPLPLQHPSLLPLPLQHLSFLPLPLQHPSLLPLPLQHLNLSSTSSTTTPEPFTSSTTSPEPFTTPEALTSSTTITEPLISSTTPEPLIFSATTETDSLISSSQPGGSSLITPLEPVRFCTSVSVDIPTLSEGIEDCDTVSDGSLPALLCTLYDPQSSEWTEEELKEACLTVSKNIKVSRSQAIHLFESTREQAASEVWFEHRVGRITASYMHDAFKHTGRKYPSSLVKSILRYTSVNPDIPALKWGRENEEKARMEYLQYQRNRHKNFRISSSGFVVSPALPYLGASPDGISFCDCCGSRLLEIKCPFKYRFVMPTSSKAISDKQYCLQSTGDSVFLSRKHRYYTQVQGQLLVTGYQQCDFVCWTTEGIFVQSIEKDNTYIAAMVQKLRLFFSKYLLPELLTQNFKKELETSAKYCYCKRGEEGKMIACDNSACTVVWFHFPCVGIKCAPKGKWYCKDCKPLFAGNI